MNRFFCIIILFSLISCTSQKPAEVSGQKPSATEKNISETTQPLSASGAQPYSLQITPENATRNSIINMVPKGFNLPDARIEWLSNDKLTISDMSYQFNGNTAGVKKGDKIQAKAIIQDKEILSNIITIKNSPPEFTKIKIMPEVFKAGDTLYVDVEGNDADGDPVTILYEWTKNGEPAGNGQKISGPIKRGDKTSVKITLFDGEAYSRQVPLDREIKNLPPMIVEDKNFSFDGKTYTYQVKATDPDGDPLTYSLKSAPSGITINPKTGLINWSVPKDFIGKVPLTASVTDGQGGEATQQLTFIIDLQKK